MRIERVFFFLLLAPAVLVTAGCGGDRGEEEVVTLVRGQVLERGPLTELVRKVSCQDARDDETLDALAVLAALNRRDNPLLTEVICNECDARLANRDAIGFGVMELLTWISDAGALACIRKSLRTCSREGRPEADLFLELLRRRGTCEDLALLDTIRSSFASESWCSSIDAAKEDLRYVVEIERDVFPVGKMPLPPFLGAPEGSRALLCQGLRLLREWPRSDADTLVRGEVYRALQRTPSHEFGALMQLLCESLALPPQSFPGRKDLESEGGTVVLRNNHRPDTGNGVVFRLRQTQGDQLFSYFIGLDDMEKAGRLILSLQEMVGDRQTKKYAQEVYDYLNTNWMKFTREEYRVATATWIARASSDIRSKSIVELGVFAAIDYETTLASRDPRLHRLIQYLRWRLPEKLVPSIQRHRVCDGKCVISREEIAEVSRALTGWQAKFTYDSATGTFLESQK